MVPLTEINQWAQSISPVHVGYLAGVKIPIEIIYMLIIGLTPRISLYARISA
jgi:hypothetical protein